MITLYFKVRFLRNYPGFMSLIRLCRNGDCSTVTFRDRYRTCRCPGYILPDDTTNSIFDSSLPVFPHIINACIFSSAFSSGNTILFGASRLLYGLALRGQAPKIFTRCTKDGLPFLAVLVSVRGATLIF